MLTMRIERGVGLRPPQDEGPGVEGSLDAGSYMGVGVPADDWKVDAGAGGGGRLGSQEG